MRFAKNKLLLFILLVPMVVTILLAFAITASTQMIDAEFIRENIVEIGRESLGATIEVEEVVYSPWTGAQIKGFSIRDSRLDSDARLLNVDEIQIEYSLAKIILGRLEISKVVLIHPSILVRCDKTGCNYDFLSKPNQGAAQTKDAKNEEPNLVQLLELRKKVISPLLVQIKKVGITRGELSIHETIDGVQKSKTIENLNFQISLEAWMRSNNLKIEFPNNVGPLLLTTNEKIADGKLLSTQLKFEQDCALQLKNLAKIDINCSFSGSQIEGDKGIRPIEIGLNAEIAMLEGSKKIEIRKFDFKVSDIASLSFKLDLEIENILKGQYPVDLESAMVIDFAEIDPWLTALQIPWNTSGRFTMPSLSVKGTLDLEKLKKMDSSRFPVVESSFVFKELIVRSPANGLDMSPLSGSMNFGASNDLVSGELDVDLALDLKLAALSLFPKFDLAGVKGGVLSGVSISGRSTASLPSARDGELNLQLKIDSIKLFESKNKAIEQRFELNIASNLDKVTKSGILKANVELGDSSQVSANLSCRSNCEQADLVFNSQLSDISKIFKMLRPLIAMGTKELVLPTELAGRGNINATVSVASEKPAWLSSLSNITGLDYTATVNLQDVAMEDPFRGISLVGSRTYFNLYGNSDKQSVVLDQRINKFAINKPREQALSLRDVSFSAEIQNELSLDEISKKMPEPASSGVDVAVYIGGLSFGDVITKPLRDLRAHLLVEQEKARLFRVKKLYLEAPELGVSVNSAAKFGMDRSRNISDLEADLGVVMHNIKGRDLSDATSIQGSIGLDISVSAPELDSVNLEGDIALADFSFSSGKTVDKRIEVKRANGNLPFSQNFKISQIKKALGLRGKKTKEVDLDLMTLAEQYLERFKKLKPKVKSAYLSKELTSGRTMFGKKTPLIFEKIQVANLVFRKMLLDLEVSQNWFKLNQFIFEFLGGRIQGSVGLAFNPLPIALKTDIHISRLNTRKLIEDFPNLRSKASSWALFASPFIDATVHVQHNIVSKDIEGQIDITSIGVEQLKMILYYIDPEEKDPSLRGLISMLDLSGVVADVDLVRIPIQNGMMDLDIDLNFLAAPLPIPKIERIPIGQLIDNYTSQALPAEEGEDASG